MKLLLLAMVLLCGCAESSTFVRESTQTPTSPPVKTYICDRNIETFKGVAYETSDRYTEVTIVLVEGVHKTNAHRNGWGYMPDCYFKIVNGKPEACDGI